MDAVDLDDHEVEMSRSGAIHSFMRAADSATKRREVADFETGRRRGGRNVALGQAHRPLEFARGDGDQHLVHRPFAEPILPDRASQLGRAFLAVEAANARTLDIDLAAVKADLALRPPPSMRPAFRPAHGASRKSPRILLHHFAQRLIPAARQNRSKLAVMPASASLFNACVGTAVDVISFLMALLSFSESHPEPTGSRRATPPGKFQQRPGHPRNRLNPRTSYGGCGGVRFGGDSLACTRFAVMTCAPTASTSGRISRAVCPTQSARVDEALVGALAEMYVQGVWFRGDGSVVRGIGSRLVDQPGERVAGRGPDGVRPTPAVGAVSLLILDTRYERSREGGVITCQAVLVAVAVDGEGAVPGGNAIEFWPAPRP